MLHLPKLLADNRSAKRKFEIVSQANEATIYLYDAIVDTDATAEWWGGVSAESAVKQIRSLQADVIHLRINSPGGDVFAARAIEQALRDHSAKKIAYIDGYAASAASFLMLAADEIEMASGGFVMIHNSWTIAMGNASDISRTAELLRKIDSTMAESYAQRTAQEPEQIANWMDAETWFTAQEAVDAGFADRISETKAKATWNLSAYANAPSKEPTEEPAPEKITEPEHFSADQRSHRLRTLAVTVATA